jgi:hypothetical protein
MLVCTAALKVNS